MYGVILRTFGFMVRPLFTFWVILGYRFWAEVGLLLDSVFFPAWKTKPLDRPVFIVGNPRSGTTFLHRFLVGEGLGAGYQLWGLVFPSLTWRTLLRPIVPRLEAFSPAKFHKNAAHQTSLMSVETDDVLPFFRYLDGLFMYGYFWAWDEADAAPEMLRDMEVHAQRDFSWLRDALKRNLVWHNQDRAIAKQFTMSVRPEAVFTAFPDAVILYMLRDPVDVIPSGMSLVTGVLKQRYDWSKVKPEVKARYVDRLYKGMVALYKGFAEAHAAGKLPAKQVVIVRYDRMMADFEGTMKEICDATGFVPDAKLQAKIRETAEKQRKHKSEHKYALEEYGLSAEQIRKDCAFVYETYGITPKG